jgi:flagellar biosynthesis protein FlhA
MNRMIRWLGGNSDMALAMLVIGILVALFVPLPAPLLDVLILANFSFALLLLLLTFYMGKPVEFSTFPSLLLVATLFRLSLNIAATRLILGQGDAGRVIAAVGSYVVGGNYVIGMIVFLILVVVQYVVVTNGAQRVSEVAARFTLDSMPGQQMSIDADLNMGFIDQEEAQRRRRNINKEAAFYGAMDGASKFVKGDAIAGIVILLIDSIGGLVVGVMQMGMPWHQALQTFTLLSIGDGIVTQVPALVISVATGLIVTRSASDSNLGLEAMRQVTSFPKTLGIVIAALAGLALLPGIPALPVAALIAAAAVVMLLRRAASGDSTSGAASTGAQSADAAQESETYELVPVEPLEVLLGANLVAFLGTDQSAMTERIAAFRKQFALEAGMVIPGVRFRNGPKVAGQAYEICSWGVVIAQGELYRDRLLAVHPSDNARPLRGVQTQEPAYGLRAIWIEPQERDAALAAQYTIVEPATVMMTHLCEVIRQNAAALLNRKEVDRLLATVRERQPGLVEEVIPTLLPAGDVQKVLQNLLRERVPIRNLEAIVEALAEHARAVKDTSMLTELVRQRLAPAICQSVAGVGKPLNVLTLDLAIEQKLLQGLRPPAEGAPAAAFAVEPKLAEQVIARLVSHCERMAKDNHPPVLLCAPELRRHLRALSERLLPHLRILSLSEVSTAVELRSFATVRI